jgi:hypothetical protein
VRLLYQWYPHPHLHLRPAHACACCAHWQVEAGIVNDNWRIRQSSVELLGDLLFKVSQA